MVLRRFYITENVNGMHLVTSYLCVCLITALCYSPCTEVEGEQSFEDRNLTEAAESLGLNENDHQLSDSMSVRISE